MSVICSKATVQPPACRGHIDLAELQIYVQPCHENTFIRKKMTLPGQYLCGPVTIMHVSAHPDFLNNANICSLHPHLCIYETCPKCIYYRILSWRREPPWSSTSWFFSTFFETWLSLWIFTITVSSLINLIRKKGRERGTERERERESLSPGQSSFQ